MTETGLAIKDRGYDLALPDMETLKTELEAVRAFQSQVKKLLIEGHDYGVIPGTEKPTLFQPGAEKMDKILHLADSYEVEVRQEDWQKPFFYYLVRCRLNIIGTNVQVAEGLGSCNSMEDRYRWRWVFQSQLPEDLQGDEGKVERDRLRWKNVNTKNGVAKQYRVENDNIFSLVNTFLKMARKRAHIAASLSAGRLSDVFTQDMEDIADASTTGGNEPEPGEVSTEHFCQIHKVPFFKKGKMRTYAHKIEGTDAWCNEPEGQELSPTNLDRQTGEVAESEPPSEQPKAPAKPPISEIDLMIGSIQRVQEDGQEAWQTPNLASYLKTFTKKPAKSVREGLTMLTPEQLAEVKENLSLALGRIAKEEGRDR